MPVMLVFGLAVAAIAQNSTIEVRGSAGTSSTTQSTASDDAGLIDEAFKFIEAQRRSDAISVLDGIIARAEARYANEGRQIYTSRSPAEAILYAGLSASQKKSAIILDETWSQAYFLKGFALIDLGRSDEAKPLFDKAIAMAPMNSHYLGERGEWYKSRRDWDHAYADFSKAAAGSELSPDTMKSFDKLRAWRGMSFVRVEQGRLDEAEKLLRQCLDLDPNDGKAKHELEYIASLRGKPS